MAECVEQVTLPSELAPGGFRASRGHHSSRQNRHNVISRWLQPYPDVLLEGIADPTPGSEARYSQSQAIQSAFDRSEPGGRSHRSPHPLPHDDLYPKLRLPAFVQARSLTGDR
jgi:hypothetical protein